MNIVVQCLPKVRKPAKDLVSELARLGYSVSVQETKPARSAVSSPNIIEMVGIFVGTGVATTLINAAVTDMYNSARNWARDRFKRQNRPDVFVCGFTIYGPDGQPLVFWRISNQGEQETDYREH
jgi:hypothetical protein